MDSIIENSIDSYSVSKKAYMASQYYSESDLILQKYKVLSKIPFGAMSSVYHCYDIIEKREVALKTITPTLLKNQDFIGQFFNEAETCIQIENHMNVVKTYFIEKIDKYPYIVTEWVEGHITYGNTLDDWLKPYTFPLRETLDICMQFCSGMIHCSEQFVKTGKIFIHRDIKPDNILMTMDGHVKITDFGLSGVHGIRTENHGYASPEMVKQNFDEICERSDIYSFGKVMEKLLNEVKENNSSTLMKQFNAIINNCTQERIDLRCESFLHLYNLLLELYEKGFGVYKKPHEIERKKLIHLLERAESYINIGKIEKASTAIKTQDILKKWNPYFSLYGLDINDYIEIVSGHRHKYYMAEFERLNGCYINALEFYSECIKKKDDYALYWYRWGTLLQQMGYYIPAAAKFIQSLILDSKSNSALSSLIDIYSLLYNPQQSTLISIMQLVLGYFINTNTYTGAYFLKLQGAYLQLKGDILPAIEKYKEFIENHENDLIVSYNLAYCLFNSCNFIESSKLFQRIINEIENQQPQYKQNIFINRIFTNSCFFIYQCGLQIENTVLNENSSKVNPQLINYIKPRSNPFSISPSLRSMLTHEQISQYEKKQTQSIQPEMYCPEVNLFIEMAKSGNDDAANILVSIFQGDIKLCNLLSFAPTVDANIAVYEYNAKA